MPTTTNLQTASGGRFLGATGCDAAEMPGTVTLPAPMGGMMVGALDTTGVAVVPGAAALVLVVVKDPEGPPAGADAGAAAAPIVVVPDGALAAAAASAAAVAAAAAELALGPDAGLASVTHHAGAAASRRNKQASPPRGQGAAKSIMRLAWAPAATRDGGAAPAVCSRRTPSVPASEWAAG